MTSKKYPVEQTTKEKIKDLFAYRKLTDLLGMTDLVKNQPFINQLIDLQYQIYMLDEYLESKWELSEKELDPLWQAIRGSLKNAGYSPKKIKKLLSDIKKYQQIEQNCRKDKWPTKVSFRKFYHAKSCDVRLIRHLIYKAQPDLANTWEEDGWYYYDIITEVHDDVADLQEDLKTYNGNRFLISLLRKGADKTLDQYEGQLNKTLDKAIAYFADKQTTGKYKELEAWTLARAKETIKLLNSKEAKRLFTRLSDSLLLSQMN